MRYGGQDRRYGGWMAVEDTWIQQTTGCTTLSTKPSPRLPTCTTANTKSAAINQER